LNIHPPAQAGSNDGSGAGAGKEVEMVREPQIRGLVVFAQEGLNAQEYFQGEDAADSTTVQRQDVLHRYLSSLDPCAVNSAGTTPDEFMSDP
jgi:hypothetical protein